MEKSDLQTLLKRHSNYLLIPMIQTLLKSFTRNEDPKDIAEFCAKSFERGLYKALIDYERIRPKTGQAAKRLQYLGDQIFGKG